MADQLGLGDSELVTVEIYRLDVASVGGHTQLAARLSGLSLDAR